MALFIDFVAMAHDLAPSSIHRHAPPAVNQIAAACMPVDRMLILPGILNDRTILPPAAF